jgi:hypothetical protein
VDGAGGSSASEDDDNGTWRAIENEKGLKLIELKSTKHGTTGYMEIKLEGSKLQMVWYDEWQEFLMKKNRLLVHFRGLQLFLITFDES